MIRKLTSTNYTAKTVSIALLVLRVGVATLMLNHGYDKFTHFNEYKNDFMNFLGLGMRGSLALVIFAELFCSAMILIGLFTSLFTIPLIITMGVALFMAHGGAIFEKGELATLYLIVYVGILIVGPGRYSFDAVIAERINNKLA